MLTSERCKRLAVLKRTWIAEVALNIVRASNGFGQPIAKAQFVFPAYFRRNRSTRPAVSSSFCFPVKNGWQLEQTSKCSSETVERVCQLLPQAQWTVAVAYSG